MSRHHGITTVITPSHHRHCYLIVAISAPSYVHHPIVSASHATSSSWMLNCPTGEDDKRVVVLTSHADELVMITHDDERVMVSGGDMVMKRGYELSTREMMICRRLTMATW
jgi:hypothetical protein